MDPWAIALVLVGAFVLARWLRIGHLRRQIRQPVPVAEAGPGLGDADEVLHGALRDPGYRLGATEIGAYGALGAAEYVWSVWSIDPDVVKAAAFSATQTVGSASELVQYLSSHLSGLDAASRAGFSNRLLGYIGEQKAAALLEAHGHYVQVASTANQPIWDLLVDGKMANIKTVASTSGIREAAAAHPYVTYFVPSDVHGAVGDNIQVLPGFDHASIAHSLNHAIDVLNGDAAFHAFLHHVPIVTVCFVIYRQAMDVRAGQNLARAIRFGAIDAVIRGGGIVIGAKVGGVTGSLFGPHGTVIGSVIGAAGGGLVGGKLVFKIKSRRLRQASAELESELNRYSASCSRSRLSELGHMIDRSLRRASDANLSAQMAAAEVRKSTRWFFWPSYSDVLVVETARVGAVAFAAAQQRLVPAMAMIRDAWDGADAAGLGIAMLNSPELASALEADEGVRTRAVQRRVRVIEERRKLDPRFKVEV